jgi:hypothetical protein
MSVLESWFLFQKRKSKSAERILREAQEELCDTDDYITLANIPTEHNTLPSTGYLLRDEIAIIQLRNNDSGRGQDPFLPSLNECLGSAGGDSAVH